MSNPDILFRGIPRAPTRGYTARYLAAVKPEKVVIPCTGSFALAYVAREAGVLPKNIMCGDISLYSTALGHAFMGMDWQLGIKDTAPEDAALIVPYLTDPISKAAAVLYMVRLLQYNSKKTLNRHKAAHQRELRRNVSLYIEQLKAQIQHYAEALQGIQYAAQDMWVTLDDYSDHPRAVLLTNPPRYTGGYERMFAGIDEVFEWQEPSASQFTEKDYPHLMEMLGNAPAHTLMYYATQGEDPAPTWGEPWQSVFADLPASLGKVAAINWIVANHNPVGVDVSRARLHLGKAKYKLFEGEITPNAVLQAVKVPKPIGDYYQDLFKHRLPGSQTEVYVAILLDGCLLSIVGLHLADFRRGKVVRKGDKVLDHCASLTFAFTVPHDRYSRLHKLTLGSLISTWFWDDLLGSEKTYAIEGAPKYLKTTMLTQHPENKTWRGIGELDSREQQPDGSYKLTYSALVLSRKRTDTLQWWAKKFAESTK